MIALITIGLFYITGGTFIGNRLHWKWWVLDSHKWCDQDGILRTSRFSSQQDAVTCILLCCLFWGFWIPYYLLSHVIKWHPRHQHRTKDIHADAMRAAKIAELQRSELGRDAKGNLL